MGGVLLSIEGADKENPGVAFMVTDISITWGREVAYRFKGQALFKESPFAYAISTGSIERGLYDALDIAIDRLTEEAGLYIEGERSQQNLFPKEEE